MTRVKRVFRLVPDQHSGELSRKFNNGFELVAVVLICRANQAFWMRCSSFNPVEASKRGPNPHTGITGRAGVNTSDKRIEIEGRMCAPGVGVRSRGVDSFGSGR